MAAEKKLFKHDKIKSNKSDNSDDVISSFLQNYTRLWDTDFVEPDVLAVKEENPKQIPYGMPLWELEIDRFCLGTEVGKRSEMKSGQKMSMKYGCPFSDVNEIILSASHVKKTNSCYLLDFLKPPSKIKEEIKTNKKLRELAIAIDMQAEKSSREKFNEELSVHGAKWNKRNFLAFLVKHMLSPLNEDIVSYKRIPCKCSKCKGFRQINRGKNYIGDKDYTFYGALDVIVSGGKKVTGESLKKEKPEVTEEPRKECKVSYSSEWSLTSYLSAINVIDDDDLFDDDVSDEDPSDDDDDDDDDNSSDSGCDDDLEINPVNPEDAADEPTQFEGESVLEVRMENEKKKKSYMEAFFPRAMAQLLAFSYTERNNYCFENNLKPDRDLNHSFVCKNILISKNVFCVLFYETEHDIMLTSQFYSTRSSSFMLLMGILLNFDIFFNHDLNGLNIRELKKFYFKKRMTDRFSRYDKDDIEITPLEDFKNLSGFYSSLRDIKKRRNTCIPVPDDSSLTEFPNLEEPKS